MPVALITGATGQDGSYLAERLRADGWEVHALVRNGDPSGSVLAPEVVQHEADLRDAESLREVVARVRPDSLYNLAGVSSVAQSWEEPLLTAQVSGLAAAVLLESAWELGRSTGSAVRFLQASSAEIFGQPDESPQNEHTPIRPINPYGAAKAFAHHLVGVYRARGLHAVSCILYNHESPRRPEQFVTRKITRTVAEISLGTADRLVLGNLDARRDWGWAPDVVDGLVRALAHDVPDDYVFATGKGRSVRDFVAAAFAAIGRDDWDDLVETDPRFVRPADATALVGDAAKARTVLGWTPTVGFDEMVRAMVLEDLRQLSGTQG